MRCGDARRDGGFTLIELLIVIVILGMLATVTVFAVRGITDKGTENACASELRTLSTAEEQNWVLTGSYAAEADLVVNQAITVESTMYDVTSTGQTYAITPASGSSCTLSSTGGDDAGAVPVAAGPDRTTYAISLNDLQSAPGGASNFDGHDSIEYNTGGGNNEILIFGRGEGELDFVDMVNAAPATSRRIAFVNLDEFAGTADLASAMNTSRSNGFTTFALYPDDDPGNTILAFLTGEVGGPNEELVLLDVFGGPNPTLLDLIASIG